MTGKQRLAHDFCIMYDLHKLGWHSFHWHSFQQLCHTIGAQILGQTLESFADSNDGGRDGAFKGTWNPDGYGDLEGTFVIQCKFTARANGRLTPSGVSEEVDKAKALVEQGICDSYILMTNATITGTSNRKIRKMGDSAFTKSLLLHEPSIDRFVARREQFLQETIRGLDADSRAILALIFLRRGRLQSPIELQPLEEHAIGRLGSDLAGCTSAATSLAASFVHRSHIDGEAFWQFRHPTIGDAYAAVLAENPEHLAVFVAGSDPDKLVAQITCGDVGMERATIVPRSMFSEVMGKLDELDVVPQCHHDDLTRDSAERGLLAFLARRCTDEFLQLFLDQHPNLLDQISEPGRSLDYVPEVPLVLRIHDLDLLPETSRKRFLDTASRYLLNAWDAGALSNQKISNLYRPDEFSELIQSVRDEVLANLEDIRESEENSWQEAQPRSTCWSTSSPTPRWCASVTDSISHHAVIVEGDADAAGGLR